MTRSGNWHGIWLSTSDNALVTAFGTTSPSVTRNPHCIFPIHDTSVEALFECVGAAVGVWGNASPAVDESGMCYLEPPDSRIVSDFKLWSLPENQLVAKEYAWGAGGGFTMMIPADIDPRVLESMYDDETGDDEYRYYECIERLGTWISKIGWAFVPLQYEAQYGMFVVRSEDIKLLEKVRTLLRSRSVDPVFHVDHEDGRQVWKGPIYRTSCT